MPLPPLKDPPGFKRRLQTLTVSVPLSGFLMSTLLAGNLGQTLSLGLLPFSRHAFRRANRELADWWWGICVTASHRINHVELMFTGDEIPPRENAIVVVNHQQMPDITFLMVLAREKGRLGDMKWFVKDQLKYVPGVGWGMVFLDCLFVKRDWASDVENIRQTFGRITRDSVPLWLMLFPEGTRFKPEKLERSRDFARKKGLHQPEHTLVPRTKGFVASVQGLGEHLDAVYDITIGYEEGVPNLWQYVKGVCTRAHLHVHRAPARDLPETDEGLSNWLMHRFKRKDELLDHFYKNGAFPDGQEKRHLSQRHGARERHGD